uniref:DNA-directed RNA polymerase subunit beta'' n=1 Tax=Ostreobium sp. HV05007bc TaxID=1940403 RepID=A0A1X9ZI33_9CHLO|nr:RNA polymerase b-subunit [Ostreobium sp. HV05007bc]
MNNSIMFFNRCFDKKRLKNFILWFFSKYGERKTIQLIENLKEIGFQYATRAGISIGIDDLKIPFIKSDCINITEQKIKSAEVNYQRGNITEIERQQQFVDEWSFVSEKLKRSVIQFFKATDIFNPIYMMAFSGARGNISQIRQLIGMRGLMADPQGQILDFPIRSSFREGLTLTEYLISCYGARKGVVDTALRTATSGYLTRRLVDVTQQVVVGRQNCHTNRGVQFTNLMDGTKTLLPLKDRIIGRVLLNDISRIDPLTKKRYKIGFKNQEISIRLARKIQSINNQILLRSPLTCCSKNSICQLCYGWNLAYNAIVSIGEAVGVIAAQSIGEPGTQLTMRTFHTGGVFTGGLIDQIYAPFNGEVKYVNNFNGVLIRTLKGRIGFLTKTEGALQVKANHIKGSNTINQDSKAKLVNLFFSHQFKKNSLNRKKVHFLLREILAIEKNFKAIRNQFRQNLVFNIPIHTILFIRHGSLILENDLIAELSSISISDNRRQETEKEIFAPVAGQVFFEKLILIEKAKRDGSIQKMTYGLGSLWIVSATDWSSLASSQIFPSHGDFVSKSSVIQRLQILNEKFCYVDQFILDSLYSFTKFRSGLFLTKKTSDINLKSKLFDHILLNQTFYSNNFRKIYYKYFRYFASINNRDSYLNRLLHLKNNNLSTREYIRKNNQPKADLKNILLGLNFRFYQSNTASGINEQTSKANLLFSEIQSAVDQSKENFFCSLISSQFLIKSNLRKIIVSRKLSNSLSKVFAKDVYQYWSNTYSLFFINLLNIPSRPFWIFSKKRAAKSFDFMLLKQNINFFYLYNYIFKTKKIKIQHQKENIFQLKKYKVSKFFFVNCALQNFVLYASSSKISNKYNWVSIKQSTSILINRQSSINLQLSKLWSLSKTNTFQPSFFNYSYGTSNNIQLYIFNSFLEKFYNIKPSIKPIIINPSLFANFGNEKFYLNSYIIQSFLISFYYKHLSDLKFDNYFYNSFKQKNKKIGFQTQFKISTIPCFINNETYNKLFSQRKKAYFENEAFTFLQKNALLNKKFKTQQSIFNWPCTYRNKIFTEEFGYYLNFGLSFKHNICFDRQQIVLDIFRNKISCKLNLVSFFPFRNFRKLKIRFLTHRLVPKNLIIFQKIENHISPKYYYFKLLNVNNDYKNQEYHSSLAFNFINNYFISFNKSLIKKNRSFHLFYLDSSQKVLDSKKIFLKIGFLKALQIKAKNLFSLEYPILLKTYFPLRKRETKKFNFRLTKSQKSNYYIYNHLIFFSLKAFCLNLVQKLNFQKISNNKVKEANFIRVFYKKFEYCSIRDLVYIDFFFSSTDGEIIQINSKKQKSKDSFIVLTRLNLKTFNFDNPATAIRSEALMLNNFLRYGVVFENQKILSNGGQVIYIDKQKFTIREAIPFLITSKSLINVHQNELIKKGSRLFTFLSYQVKTGDIIQGIPKIEEFFEARLTRDGLPLITNLHTQIKQFFQNYRLKFSVFEATQKSFEKIQYLIINEIQKVYCSQGIFIADKHLEIVVRQMTSKVQVIKGGKTGLLSGELVELDWIRSIELQLGDKEVSYEPIVLGITKSCLETESFISAASFQETTRILTKAAIQNKIDFVRGLKQNVILGNLVPAGTGFFSPLYIKYSKFD